MPWLPHWISPGLRRKKRVAMGDGDRKRKRERKATRADSLPGLRSNCDLGSKLKDRSYKDLFLDATNCPRKEDKLVIVPIAIGLIKQIEQPILNVQWAIRRKSATSPFSWVSP
jgi:hypothetical protein